MAQSNAVKAVTGEIFRDGWTKVRGSSQGLGAKRGQMARAAAGHRSAVFKAIRGGGTHTRGQLINQLEYLTTKSSHIVDSRGVFDGNKQLTADQIKSVADRFTERWDKGFNPKLGHTTHMLMSFPVSTSGKDVRDIASNVCERFFSAEGRTFDYLIAVHEDRAHPHAHVVLNRRSQEGELFFLGRDHHFNYDDFRLAMVEEAEKYGVRLEATRRLDRGVVEYAPRTREIYAAKEEGREPVGRVRIGRDLDRALAEIASNTKVYHSLAAEASAENREDIANALFRAGELLARGGHLEQHGEVYMANDQSFDDLRSRFAENMERVEAMIAATPEGQRPQAQARLNEIQRSVEHMQPLGVRSHTLTEPPTEGGIYTEGNVNRDALDRLREPEVRAQIETALRGTGISSETVISRIETTANNAALERTWLSDDLRKIADTDGLNLERREDLQRVAERLDQVHVQLGTALERAEVLRDNDLIEVDEEAVERDLDRATAAMQADMDDPSYREFLRERAETEDYREQVSEDLRTEAGIARAENEGIEAMRGEGISTADRREFAELQERFARTDFNYSYSDDPQARSAGQEQTREASEAFEAYAAKSPLHAAMASSAWDRATDIMRGPDGYMSLREREPILEKAEEYELMGRPLSRDELERAIEEDRDMDAQLASQQDAGIARAENDGIAAWEKADREALKQATIQQGVGAEIARYKAEGYSREAIGGHLMEIDERVEARVALAEARGEQLGSWDRLVEADKREELRELEAEVGEATSRISPEVARVIEHERTDKINPPFDSPESGAAYRMEIERELSDDRIDALRKGDADSLDEVIDDRLERLYAAKAYLQSDAATANSDAAREVISEIADEEFDAHRLKHAVKDSEKGQTHG